MSKTRKNYTLEFKQEAVKLAKKVGCTKAGTDLGVHRDSIRRWANALNASKNGNNPSGAPVNAEVRRLLKENGYLKKINEVLKKSTAIFSNDHMRDLR